MYENAQPTNFSLSLNKALQFNLTMALAKTYESEGIRTGVMAANKIVRVDEKYHNPKHIGMRASFGTCMRENKGSKSRFSIWGMTEWHVPKRRSICSPTK